MNDTGGKLPTGGVGDNGPGVGGQGTGGRRINPDEIEGDSPFLAPPGGRVVPIITAGERVARWQTRFREYIREQMRRPDTENAYDGRDPTRVKSKPRKDDNQVRNLVRILGGIYFGTSFWGADP